MRFARTMIDAVATVLLPGTTASAACTESFLEYRCQCTSCGATCGRGKRQQRTCRYCNNVKSCSGWICDGTNCTRNCPC